MSKNYDLIATVDIDIASPLVDDTSFDNLLIVGPLPKVAPDKAPPKVGAYSSMNEVLEAGWVASGDDADPVGLAAQVAFGQSPTPNTIYIAPKQLTAAAVASGKAIEVVQPIIDAFVREESSNDYTAKYDAAKRVLLVDLAKKAEEISTHPEVDPIDAIVKAGYTVHVKGGTVGTLEAFKSTEAYTQVQTLEEANDETTVQFIVNIHDEAGADVPYGIIVRYPNEPGDIPAFTGGPIGNPQDEIESAVDTLQRAMATSGWYVACSAGIDPAEYEEIAAYMETQEKMFAYTEMGFFGTESGPEMEDAGPKPSVGTVYFRTLGVYGRERSDQPDEEVPPANWYMNVAFVAKWLNYSSGSETSAFKTLASVYPSELTTTEMKALAEANLNYFVTVGNKNITMNGKVVGDEWADIIRFRDWLKNDMQVRVVNLFITRPKVPYTDAGIALVQNQMIASLRAGQDAGGIAEEEFDEDGNTIPGFTTSVPLSASLSASEKASRKLTKCTFKARLAGAIHFAELKGSLTYEL